MVVSKVEDVNKELKNLETTIKNETKLSFDPITICISELDSYISALKKENNIIGPG